MLNFQWLEHSTGTVTKPNFHHLDKWLLLLLFHSQTEVFKTGIGLSLIKVCVLWGQCKLKQQSKTFDEILTLQQRQTWSHETSTVRLYAPDYSAQFAVHKQKGFNNNKKPIECNRTTAEHDKQISTIKTYIPPISHMHQWRSWPISIHAL